MHHRRGRQIVKRQLIPAGAAFGTLSWQATSHLQLADLRNFKLSKFCYLGTFNEIGIAAAALRKSKRAGFPAPDCPLALGGKATGKKLHLKSRSTNHCKCPRAWMVAWSRSPKQSFHNARGSEDAWWKQTWGAPRTILLHQILGKNHGPTNHPTLL